VGQILSLDHVHAGITLNQTKILRRLVDMDKTKVTLFEKLQNVRVDLNNMSLKKTGKNQTFKYYELKDFLPYAMELFATYKLCSNISFYPEMAVLTIYNSENPEEKLSWTSTLEEANIRSGSKVQALGAMQTYIRRYLYTNALELTENDIEDGLYVEEEKKPAPAKEPAKKVLTDAQVKRLYTIASKKGFNDDQVKAVIKKEYKKDSANDLTKKEYDELVNRLEAK